MTTEEKFNYCVGRCWDNSDGSICAYAYGSQIHCGSLKQAQEYLEFVRQREFEYSGNTSSDYKIFKVTEL